MRRRIHSDHGRNPSGRTRPGASRRESRRPIVLVAMLVLAGAASAVPSWGKSKAQEVLLPDGFPPITEAEKALVKVPYAEGAPAAVLLEARQNEWFEAGDAPALRSHFFRRLKVLTEAGVEEEGDYTLTLYGEWRVKKVEARTVLPDGTEVDAKEGVFQEKSDSGDQIIRIAFPRVQVGAILDVHATVAADYAWYVDPWVLQEPIPVLRSRFIMMPPKGLKYRTAGLKLSPEKTKPESVRMAERTAFVWTFENVEALPEEPNLPPLRDISQTLFVIPEEYRDETFYIPLAKDWKSYSGNSKDAWDEWMRKKSSQTAALAKQVTAGKTSVVEKAEAIRRALRERIRLEYHAHWWNSDSPDDLLAKGAGTSGEIAGTAAAMLRACGVEATLAAIRRRSSGLTPVDFPVPSLYNDLLVRIQAEKGPLFFSPVADLPVQLLPWDCTDLYALPFDGKAEAPVKIPDFRAADNKAVRTAQARLAGDGALSGESVETYQGVSAEIWRRLLRPKDAEARKEALREHIQRWIPGAQVKSLEIANLDEDTKELSVRTEWAAEDYASSAGKRVLANLNLFSRISANDWAPAQRKNEIDLGSNFEQIETVTLILPEGVVEVTLPAPSSMNAGPVGLYEASYEKGEGKIVAKRHMRLEMHRFPVPAYSGLKHWFSDIAAADDRPVALTMK